MTKSKPINTKNAMAAYIAAETVKDRAAYRRKCANDRTSRFADRDREEYERFINSAEYLDAIAAFEDARKPIDAALDAVQGKARVRTVTAAALLDALVEIEKKNLMGIPKAAREGVRIAGLNLNAQSFPRAYKYTPESTKIDLEYKSGSWRIVEIERRTCSNNRGRLILTDTAKDAICDKLATL